MHIAWCCLTAACCLIPCGPANRATRCFSMAGNVELPAASSKRLACGRNVASSCVLCGREQVVEVSIDASDVPSEYALTILSECAAFPRRLVFFLKGTLSVRPRRL